MEHNLYNSTSSEEVIDKRYRHFMFILYPEWGSVFDDIITDVRGNFKKYAYIKHVPESDEKKEHVHLILSLDNARTIESITSRLKIPENLCQPIRGLRGACRYLTHADDETKKAYPINEVIISGAFTSTFLKSYDDVQTDDEILQTIYELIEQMKEMSPVELEMELTKICCQRNYTPIFKKYYNTIVKVINYKASA